MVNESQHTATSSRKRRRSGWRTIGIIFGVLIALAIVSRMLIGSFGVPTAAMENSLMTGDQILVNRLYDMPQRGDIIVFEFPGMRDQVEADQFQYYMKRCVAIAGDTLQVKRVASPEGSHQDTAFVFINGVRQPASRNLRFLNIPPRSDEHFATFPENAGFTHDDWGPMRVPKQGDVIPLNDSTYMYRIFMMREGHQVDKMREQITVDGKTVTEYTVGRDYWFGMGDNRDNSADSRYWGFVPYDNVAGRPWITLFSVDKESGDLRSDRWFRNIE